jgi:hypothetical protein
MSNGFSGRTPVCSIRDRCFANEASLTITSLAKETLSIKRFTTSRVKFFDPTYSIASIEGAFAGDNLVMGCYTY